MIEISDTTLSTDRLKARTYAAAGIAEYWIVNLVDRCVEILRNPEIASAVYSTQETLSEDRVLSVVVSVQTLSLKVSDFLP